MAVGGRRWQPRGAGGAIFQRRVLDLPWAGSSSFAPEALELGNQRGVGFTCAREREHCAPVVAEWPAAITVPSGARRGKNGGYCSVGRAFSSRSDLCGAALISSPRSAEFLLVASADFVLSSF